MSDVPQPRPAPERRPSIPSDGRKYPPFAAVERQLLSSLQTLLSRAPPATPWHTLETFTAGALTLALSYTNRRILTHSSASGISNPNPDPSASAAPSSSSEKGGPSAALTARILLITLTPLNAGQYIPLMNSLFAAQRLAIKVDVLHLFGRPSPFLQQLCHATAGIYLSLAPASPPSSPSPNGSTGAGAHADTGIPGGDASPGPRGLLQYLFTLFLPDATARKHLRAPQQAEVDFRAACFCHRRVVDVGFVCSVCLSIFCEVPPGEERGYSECLICGSRLVVKEGLGAGL